MFFDTSLRRILLAILVLAAGRSPAVSGVVRAAEAERPHIILMMSDDQGWEETGYNGHPYVQTPVLEWPRRIDEPQVSHLNASTSDLFPSLAALLQRPATHCSSRSEFSRSFRAAVSTP